ncbi:probable carboxylesterase 17 [Vigna unguiculata]|uniref:Gibberellin receptor GID1 n=1 Tax=Vigna unguiculata TaxID=3917 RepID=A0A4D6NJ02_VIGUN|nr:probable carboxylesterase 17 [Vigna unguiculata]QCE12961.1 gibberellin receptor GID1 [Vigna unguiculata]
MATISLRHNPEVNNTNQQREIIAEEIQGLIRVHRDGRVERPQIVPSVSCTERAKDVVIINRETNLRARVYVPSTSSHTTKPLPLVMYFHGGGFCVGSAAWSCYHEFLTNLASKANCVVLSVDYRLAPENRLPIAYDDGFNALAWVKREALNISAAQKWWLSHCDMSSVFLAGDSAGANIAYNVATRMGSSSSSSNTTTPLSLKGVILIQPFFGGEERTSSEKHFLQPPHSALTLSVSDTYWRLALPLGATRDHPYCNPLAYGTVKLRDLRISSIMVCVSEMDILRDRNLEFAKALGKAGKRVETIVFKGVGHAFQVLHNYQLSHSRTQEMIAHIRNFVNQ